MSVIEPKTTAKVIFHTTKGPLEIELWAKETPIACRNFLQHCLDRYYDGTIFHRIIPGFLIQGGDPTGTGLGGNSIYENGKPFGNEYHNHLRFTRRGLVGMASSSSNDSATSSSAPDNGSQFFITLAPARQLDKNHTLFGRVMGDSIYNVVKIADSELDPDDTERPLYPTRVTSTEVTVKYFNDLEPRIKKRLASPPASSHAKKRKPISRKAAVKMSYDEEENLEEDQGSAPKPFKIRSAHDVLHDSRLSREQVTVSQSPPASSLPEHKDEKEAEILVKESKAARKDNAEDRKEKPKEDSQAALLAEIELVKAQVKGRHNEMDEIRKNFNGDKPPSLVESEREKYLIKSGGRKKLKGKLKEKREAETLAMLAKFQKKLSSSKTDDKKPVQPKKQENKDDRPCKLHGIINCHSCIYFDNLEDQDDDQDYASAGDIYSHKLHFTKDQLGKDVQDARLNKLDYSDNLMTLDAKMIPSIDKSAIEQSNQKQHHNQSAHR